MLYLLSNFTTLHTLDDRQFLSYILITELLLLVLANQPLLAFLLCSAFANFSSFKDHSSEWISEVFTAFLQSFM